MNTNFPPHDLNAIIQYCDSTPDFDAYLAPAFSIKFNTNLIDSAAMIYETVQVVRQNRLASIKVDCILAVRDIIEGMRVDYLRYKGRSVLG